jgi:hypothetical protein
MNRAFSAAIVVAAMAIATTAMAKPSLDDAYFVKKDAAGQAMLADREACVTEAEQFGVDRASDFSNPEYGSLTALGAALDEGGFSGNAKQAVRRAVRDACMQKRGWKRINPSEADAKILKKANARHPEALDAWILANAPKPPPVITAPPPIQLKPITATTPVTASALPPVTPATAPPAPAAKAPEPATPHS